MASSGFGRDSLCLFRCLICCSIGWAYAWQKNVCFRDALGALRGCQIGWGRGGFSGRGEGGLWVAHGMLLSATICASGWRLAVAPATLTLTWWFSFCFGGLVSARGGRCIQHCGLSSNVPCVFPSYVLHTCVACASPHTSCKKWAGVQQDLTIYHGVLLEPFQNRCVLPKDVEWNVKRH